MTDQNKPIITDCEKKILKLQGEGKSRKMIADAIPMNENTLHTHLRIAYRKMNVRNMIEAQNFVRSNPSLFL